MGRPRTLFRSQLRTNRAFVDRTEPIETFHTALEAIDAGSSDLLVYYGIGGQGKTALCRELLRQLKRRDKHLKVGHVDLHGRRSLEPRLALLWLRNALAANRGMSFPAFDLGFGLYWKATSPEQQMPSFEGVGWLNAGEETVAESLGAGAEKAASSLVEFGLENVPFVGSVLKRLAGWAVKAARTTYTKKTNEAVKKLFGPGDETLHFTEIERQLPLLLAADLEQILLRHPETRFVLLIDEYERVIENGGLSSQLRANAFDDAIRRLAAHAQGLLLVVFSRERLPWSHQPPDGADPAAWQSWIDNAHHVLGGLSAGDADGFLAQVPITDRDVRSAMIEGASVERSMVYPLLLDLQVDIYVANLTEDGRLAVPVDSFRTAATSFEELRRKLLIRLLRDYGPETESVLKRLAVVRSFDRDLFVYLEKELPSGFPLDQFLRLTELSFIEPGAEGDFTMHRIVRSSLVEMLSADEQMETHRLLVAYFEAAATLGEGEQLRAEHMRALREAVYHQIELSTETAARWWLKFRAPFFHRTEVGALLPIEEQIIDALASRAPQALRLRVDVLRLHVNALASCGLVADARSMNQLAIATAGRLGSEDPGALLEMLLAQAELLQRENRLLEAEMMVDQVVDAMIDLKAADIALLNARALDVIAAGLERQSLWAKAELLRRARVSLALDAGTGGHEPANAIDCMLMLLRDLLAQEKYAEVAELRATLDRRIQEQPGAKQLVYQSAVVHLLVAAGRSEDARSVAAAAIALQASPPEDAVDRRWFLHARGSLHGLLEQGDRAKSDIQAWLDSVEASPAHADVDLCAPLLALAECVSDMGDVALAESSLERLARIVEQSDARTSDHAVRVLRVRISIAQAKAARAGDPGASLSDVSSLMTEIMRLDPHAAIRLQQERARFVREHLGARHAHYGAALLDLASAHLVCYQPKQALSAAREALSVCEQHVGMRHPAIAVSLSAIGSAQLMIGDTAGAEQTIGELETLLEDSELTLSDLQFIRCQSSIADLRVSQGHAAEALRALEAAQRRTAPDSAGRAALALVIEVMQAIAAATETGNLDTDWEERARLGMSAFGPTSFLAMAAQKLHCAYLESQRQFRALAEAKVVLAGMLHAVKGGDDQLTRDVFVETAMAWRNAANYTEAQKWFTKALRGFTPDAATAEWWATSSTSAAHVKFRCGLLADAASDARAVLAAELEPTAQNLDSTVSARALCAHVAIVSRDPAAHAATQELEAFAAKLPGGERSRELACRRLALLHALLGNAHAVATFAHESRAITARLSSEMTFPACELGLIETYVAHRTGRPFPATAMIDAVNGWLAGVRDATSPADPRLGEHMLRVAAAMGAVGGAERQIALLREGTELIRQACGPFHPDLGDAEHTLATLTNAS